MLFSTYTDFLYEILKLQNRQRSILDPNKIQIRFCFKSSSDYIKLFNLLATMQDCTIIVDEADALFQDRNFAKGLTNIFLGSRNNRVNMIFVGKRPFLIPILVRSQCDTYFIFGTEEDRDIKYLGQRFRKEMPKDPYDLKMGECIVMEEGKKPELKKYPEFKLVKGESNHG